ncbi:MAG: UDP-N-acetylglucosamine 2-epimerase (non-hydrolyzing) [Actinomycetota bacterium]|nr:UDP-N-acetylglucosamine 2-epimerase (non-hydrolyzing) [Actinomycetota bacterium]
MRVLTILGTRPEIIRLSLIIGKLDKLADHTLLHTGQNYAPELDRVFFENMRIRNPDVYLDSRSPTIFKQVAKILEGAEKWVAEVEPDACLILGDTYSGLSAMVAERANVPVFHMEAGNRCFDPRVPEERNRKIIDHTSSWLLPYVPNSRQNLLNEGIDKERIFVSGNPIFEVLEHYKPEIRASDILDRLHLEEGCYFLVTAHRAENVDVPKRLFGIISALNRLAASYDRPVVWSVHPRTRQKIEASGFEVDGRVLLLVPFDLFDFVKLEENAFCVLTDSGTVQEECCIFRVPAVTIRDTTERPETVECGSNVLAGCDADRIVETVKLVTETGFAWEMPEGYTDPNVSDKVIRYILGNIGRRPLLDW